MPFDNIAQHEQDRMIYEASLEELIFFKHHPEDICLTEASMILIDKRIDELEKESHLV